MKNKTQIYLYHGLGKGEQDGLEAVGAIRDEENQQIYFTDRPLIGTVMILSQYCKHVSINSNFKDDTRMIWITSHSSWGQR